MRFSTLQDWLAWQEQLHPNPIDLGLERVQRVLKAMQLERPAYKVLTVGGTNGKGSCVAFLDAMLRAQGYQVGAYTSPHLLRYNERVSIGGRQVTDAELCESFARVDTARGTTSLTYFEFGTLAALDIFRNRGIDMAVLEVGMGGRLDAVNAVDPLGALVVSVGLDHQEWLGPDRDSIGYEKAGIYRRGRPAICGDRDPPRRLLQTARQFGADLQVLGRDFDWRASRGGWDWQNGATRIRALPPPAMTGRIQYDNAASSIALLQAVHTELAVSEAAIRQGLRQARISARFERVPGEVELIFDVAHNQDAARVLASNLDATRTSGRTIAVVGMYRDKAAGAVAQALGERIDSWHLGGLGGPRGQAAAELAAHVRSALPRARLHAHASVIDAWQAARADAARGDRIVIFGSFQTVSAILRILRESVTNVA
ncbi:MAG: bifunctional tetrahydrofolate synthase/dihydrofolate synthase [Gammaproteobacteria bacterium]|nr:bifunctional tetrahydrofolate synthase/dihydrofolate synthase [Gammaproteobacteria bacterium]MDE1886732.1 bifunctional tetrahydrofolate synthase/dihydrofolate synthase [Gammaproteobacteria bacterium]MDE2022691.1 bifunctional tetrahydrofolate synthase/dihydrofolate synthase [Gammaproteobacteria bacterium]MDE2139585.1 bifunctional tetrahydrofolate synthase/dihydrofolate synthase [Gammaproteobacteria bacterium]MDE2273558.1 bifunctional tetrahydrofolate synthase/dihydrofolate synthase [Gammaprot